MTRDTEWPSHPADRIDLGAAAEMTSLHPAHGASAKGASENAKWLRAVRTFLGVTAAANPVWEILHLPLYTIWFIGKAPVRLNFRREETASCSDKVVIADFGRSADLPTGKTVSVELMPVAPGEYAFACPMGMFKGRLIVE